MPLQVSALAIWFILSQYNLPLVLAAEKHAVPVGVKRVLMDPVSNSPVVILEGLQGESLVPIWIGPFEAASIALALERRKPPRPNSHDLIHNLLPALNAKLERVTITELKDSTYFAVMTLKVAGRELHMDARPSDAIAVALRAAAPIYIAPEILNQRPGLTIEALSGTSTARRIMGFHIQNMTAELADLLSSPRTGGVLVADVELDSLASQLGFERGDVITRVDHRTIRNTGELEEVFVSRKGPRKISFQLKRKGKPITIVVDLPS